MKFLEQEYSISHNSESDQIWSAYIYVILSASLMGGLWVHIVYS